MPPKAMDKSEFASPGDAGSPAGGVSGGRWTDAEKYALLLSIIHQNSATPDWKNLQPPSGRTIKSCMHVWGHIKKEVTEFAINVDGASPAVPKARTPRAKKTTTTAITTPQNGEGDEGELKVELDTGSPKPKAKRTPATRVTKTGSNPATPKTPRKTPAKRSPKKAVAAEEALEDSNTSMNVDDAEVDEVTDIKHEVTDFKHEEM